MTRTLGRLRTLVILGLGLVPGLGTLTALAPVAGGQEGQETSEAKPQEPAPAAPASDSSPYAAELARIESLAAAVQADAILDDATRERVTSLLAQARSAFGQAKEWRRKQAEFESLVTTAPAEEERYRALLLEEQPEVALGEDARLPLPEAENRLRVVRAELDSIQREVTELDQEPQRRAERRAAIPTRVAAARLELSQLADEAAAPPPQGSGPREVEARQAAQEARRTLLEAEIAAIEAELKSYEARSALLPLRRERATRRLARAQKTVDLWQAQVELLRDRQTRAAGREAAKAEEKVEKVHPALRVESERNAELARRQQRISADLADLASEEARSKDELTRVRNAYTEARRRVDVGGSTDAVGFFLRRQRDLLPDASRLAKSAIERRHEIGKLQLEGLDLEQIRDELALEDKLVAELADTVSGDSRAQVEAAARALVREERDRVTHLLQDYENLFVLYLNLEETERLLLETTSEFEQFIDERVLWIHSSQPLWASDFRNAAEAVRWLGSGENWSRTLAFLKADFLASWSLWSVCLLPLVVLALQRRAVRRRIDLEGSLASKSSCVTIGPTFRSFLFTTLLALPLPGLIGFVGARMTLQVEAPEFAKAVGMGLRRAAIVLLLLEFVRHFSREGGLASAHLDWNSEQLKRARAGLLALSAVLVPTYLLAIVWDAQQDEAYSDTAGRVVLLISLAALAVYLARTLGSKETRPRRGLGGRWRPLAYRAGILTVIALFALAFGGYYFTCLELVDRLVETFALAVVLTLVHDLALRWLAIVRRRIARERALQRLRESYEASGDKEIPVDPEHIDIEQASVQSMQLVRSIGTLSVAIGLYLVWFDVLPALAIFDKLPLYSITETITDTEGVAQTQERPITLGDLLLALFVLGSTVIVARNVTGVLEVSILQRLAIPPGERYATVALVRYAILMMGIVGAFVALGIGWSKIQWLAAAVSVGLGFGLQEIFANFISGLILLFERPVRVGDFVTVGGTDGRVTRIRMRATTITDWDLRELIVPNREFITSRLVNWTLSNPITRVVLPVGIAYGSDTDKARSILLDLARKSPLVLKDPAPSVVFSAFGDSVLDFHLRVFIDNRDYWPEVLTTLNSAIHQRFHDEGIEIAFPQRDLHVRSLGPLQELLSRMPGLSVQELGHRA